MRRTERLQGLRLMKFEEVYGRSCRGALSQVEAAEVLGVSERTFRRWRDRYEAEGADGLYDRRLGRASARRAGVDELHEAGRIEEIRNYCELDVLNTYLVYLRYAVFTGWLAAEAHDRAVGDLVTYLASERGARPHLGEFVESWGEASGQRFLLSTPET